MGSRDGYTSDGDVEWAFVLVVALDLDECGFRTLGLGLEGGLEGDAGTGGDGGEMVKSPALTPLFEMARPVSLAFPVFLMVKVLAAPALPIFTLPKVFFDLPSARSVPTGCWMAISGPETTAVPMVKVPI